MSIFVYNSRMNQAQTDAPLRRTFRGSRDALLQKAVDEPELGWRVLITLNAFRLLISTALLLLFAVGSEPPFLRGRQADAVRRHGRRLPRVRDPVRRVIAPAVGATRRPGRDPAARRHRRDRHPHACERRYFERPRRPARHLHRRGQPGHSDHRVQQRSQPLRRFLSWVSSSIRSCRTPVLWPTTRLRAFSAA